MTNNTQFKGKKTGLEDEYEGDIQHIVALFVCGSHQVQLRLQAVTAFCMSFFFLTSKSYEMFMCVRLVYFSVFADIREVMRCIYPGNVGSFWKQ